MALVADASLPPVISAARAGWKRAAFPTWVILNQRNRCDNCAQQMTALTAARQRVRIPPQRVE
jgi:hypothetical protein